MSLGLGRMTGAACALVGLAVACSASDDPEAPRTREPTSEAASALGTTATARWVHEATLNARWGAASASAGDGRIVMFGGAHQREFGDTWVLARGAASPLSHIGPEPRELAGLAIGARGGGLLFGGATSDGVPFGDMWRFDAASGAGWTAITPRRALPPQKPVA